ncbi:MAG: helix-turn-helix domain-containing protein [Acidobacteria bacterium]|nr:helix-turn-helix domain-containing protein [Acidobacteriota bacterium]
MEKSTFGERLRLAFGNAKYAQIAAKMGVSEATVKVYMAGRVPDDKKLVKISKLTNCSLHWLLTGEGDRFVSGSGNLAYIVHHALMERLRIVAKEQAPIVFADLDIGSDGLTEATLRILCEVLLQHGMLKFGLIPAIDEGIYSDRRRAKRFSFFSNQPQSVDDRIQEIVDSRVSHDQRFTLDTQGEIRDMIREIVREEVSNSRKRPVYPLVLSRADDDDEIEETTRRKAG